MKIEQQVVSLALAKRLKEAGYPQDDSFFYWYCNSLKVKPITWRLGDRRNLGGSSFNMSELLEIAPNRLIAAPTVAELGEALPAQLNSVTFLAFYRTKLEHGVVYRDLEFGINKWVYSIWDDTEADARCKMWLYLKEKRLL